MKVRYSALHYFRRCHVCGEVSESVGELMDHCCHCGRPLAPFYYFDEMRAMGLRLESEVDPAEEHYRTTALPLKDYPCVSGISVIWS